MTAMHAAIIAMAKLTCMAVMLTMMGCAYGDHARHWVGAIQTGMRVQRANADPIAVPMHFRHTVCSEDPLVEASIWLTDLTLDELATGAVADGQALHIELMFRPRPGYTPLDSTATNISIRYIIMSRGEVGVYEGGGFGYPIGSVANGSMSLRIEGASLTLGDHTKGFIDLLTPAILSGTFNGPRDDATAAAIRKGVDETVSLAFARRTYVHNNAAFQEALVVLNK